jgi:hypothetical protein
MVEFFVILLYARGPGEVAKVGETDGLLDSLKLNLCGLVEFVCKLTIVKFNALAMAASIVLLEVTDVLNLFTSVVVFPIKKKCSYT